MSYAKHVPVNRDNTTVHYWLEIIEDTATITCLKNGNLIYSNMVPAELLRGTPPVRKQSIRHTGDPISDLMNALILEHGNCIQLYSTAMFRKALKDAGLELSYV